MAWLTSLFTYYFLLSGTYQLMEPTPGTNQPIFAFEGTNLDDGIVVMDLVATKVQKPTTIVG